MQYLVLLRGVNVGGKSIIKMMELKSCLKTDYFHNVKTYIQSGNILLDSELNAETIVTKVQQIIKSKFKLDILAVVFNTDQWQAILNDAPKWWGKENEWKHNLLILIPPYEMDEIIDNIGLLKPGIEKLEAGAGVLYQSMSKALFGKTTTGKLASNMVYSRMTIRNYNTATKLGVLLTEP